MDFLKKLFRNLLKKYSSGLQVIAAGAGTLAIAGCGPVFYVPNASNTPLFEKQGQVTAAGNIAGDGFEFQGAYSLTDKWLAHIQLTFGNRELDTSGVGGKGNLIELGGGYYGPLERDLTWGALGLAGFGEMENTYLPQRLKAKLFRIGIQPYIGYSHKILEAALSARMVNMNYSDIKGPLTLGSTDHEAYLKSSPNQVFFEPAVTFRFGYKHVYLQLQDIHSFNLSDEDFPYDANTFVAGMYFKY